MLKTDPSHSRDFQDLTEWLCYLESIHATEIDLGLSRISQVAQRLHIDLSFATVITVAGTNGKGTTCAFLENSFLHDDIAQQLSVKTTVASHGVAVYSSPHIKAFNERLRVNRQDVSDELFIEAFAQIEHARAEISLSYYEFTTLAAFLVLMKLKPSVIMLEVGLGGRLDATNIIDADVAVVTTVDIDHQAFLGNDRESIGFEKAGIMRANQIIVVGDVDSPKSVVKHAKKMLAQSNEQSAKLQLRGVDFSLVEAEQGYWKWSCGELCFAHLAPCFIPRDNVATSLCVLVQLGVDLSESLVNQLISSTKVAGRTEFFLAKESSKVLLNCDVMLDVGHNPQAARYLAQQLSRYKEQGKYKQVHAVVAMLVDKDIDNSLLALKEEVTTWNIGQLSVPRASTAKSVADKIQAYTKSVNCFDNVTQAFKIANQQASPDDLILVFGSFFTVAEIRDLLT